jgi:hypothetical protein
MARVIGRRRCADERKIAFWRCRILLASMLRRIGVSRLDVQADSSAAFGFGMTRFEDYESTTSSETERVA